MDTVRPWREPLRFGAMPRSPGRAQSPTAGKRVCRVGHGLLGMLAMRAGSVSAGVRELRGVNSPAVANLDRVDCTNFGVGSDSHGRDTAGAPRDSTDGRQISVSGRP